MPFKNKKYKKIWVHPQANLRRSMTKTQSGVYAGNWVLVGHIPV